jgi:hypothetical protein
MLGGHDEEVDAPLLDGVPRLVLAGGRHGEVGLVRDAAFTARIRGHVHRMRPCIIPENCSLFSRCYGRCMSRIYAVARSKLEGKSARLA